METKNILFFGHIMITCICLLLTSCNSGKKEGLETSNHDDGSEPDTMRSEKHPAKKSSGSFEEFVMRKNEIELQIYSTRVDEAFDPEEAVELRVELFSPRFLTQLERKEM
ncbi:MAG: hypothetical protein KAQ62_20735 [Cyclobacteriaceae bacterium]|nr:hypothetical protein [Cyclobacteriaceae bacterium]